MSRPLDHFELRVRDDSSALTSPAELLRTHGLNLGEQDGPMIRCVAPLKIFEGVAARSIAGQDHLEIQPVSFGLAAIMQAFAKLENRPYVRDHRYPEARWTDAIEVGVGRPLLLPVTLSEFINDIRCLAGPF